MSLPSAGHPHEPGNEVPQTLSQPHSYDQTQRDLQPLAASAPAVPQQISGGAIQPYYPATPPTHYAQPQVAGSYALAPVARYSLVSAGGRFGAMLLDTLLVLVTLWIGWFIWSMITWSNGQTPAKQLLGHIVADANTGEPFNWGQMALREFCIKGLLGWLLTTISCGIYFFVDSFMVFGDRQRTLHDRMANSVVRHR